MIKAVLNEWKPEQDLACLLDALADEILAVPDSDVAALPHVAAQEAIKEVRRLVATADAGLVPSPTGNPVSHGLRVHVARNQ